MSKPIKKAVSIPKTPLRTRLDETAAIKREMFGLLRELEQAATGEAVEKPGAWRHHPTEYLKHVRRPDEPT